ncbi:MAG: hypothetical protein CMF62_01635 [Magnetococcales bacterium]|nr:hypothetical protein [Magnetococcales bacterium]|tara:strand:+ start:58678 stop:58914 length:237 start_codon:yes stop_codon:yes gene_type:complete
MTEFLRIAIPTNSQIMENYPSTPPPFNNEVFEYDAPISRPTPPKPARLPNPTQSRVNNDTYDTKKDLRATFKNMDIGM